MFHAYERLRNMLKKRQCKSRLLVCTMLEEDMVIYNVLSQKPFYYPFGCIIENV